MSEINPDFSFPLAVPLPPTPLHESRPISLSPQPRPKRHAHRRSAAMSEDLSAVELATLTASPQPMQFGQFGAQLGTPESPKQRQSPPLETPLHTPLHTPMHTPQLQSPRPQFSNTSSSQMNSSSPTLQPSSSPISFASSKQQQNGGSYPGHLSSIPPLPIGILPSTPDGKHSPRQDTLSDQRSFVGLRSPSRQPIGEPGWLVPTPVVSPAQPSSNGGATSQPQQQPQKQLAQQQQQQQQQPSQQHQPQPTSKHKKRRSFVSIFRRSVDLSTQPESLPETHQAEPVFVQDDVGDDTLVAPVQLQPQLSASPIVTPRNSGTFTRDSEPSEPTIDLDEALGCSFTHRPPDHAPDPLLESPFSKASSVMGAVLEEDEDEDGGDNSEADSLFSVTRRRPASLHTPGASLMRRDSPSSPRFPQATTGPIAVPEPGSNTASVSAPASAPASAPGSTSSSVLSSFPVFAPPARTIYSGAAKQGASTSSVSSRTISYVGPVSETSSPSGSPKRSPRVSFEQVSNLAIADPRPPVAPAPLKHLSAPVPHLEAPASSSPLSSSKPSQSASSGASKKGHQRRRSLIDRLIRR